MGITNSQFGNSVKKILYVFESDTDWKDKYHTIFDIANNDNVRSWKGYDHYYDPDMDYQDDVTAFVNYLKELLPNAEKLSELDNELSDNFPEPRMAVFMRTIRETAAKTAPKDDPYYEYSDSGNYDDIYEDGVDCGEILFARALLKILE